MPSRSWHRPPFLIYHCTPLSACLKLRVKYPRPHDFLATCATSSITTLMDPQSLRRHFTDALQLAEIRLFLGSVGCFTLASRALAVVIGFQIYRITRSPLALGWLGLIEAIPALSLVPFGGYVADRFNRRAILLITRAVSSVCAILLATLSWRSRAGSLPGLYAMIFFAGIARGFAAPAIR